MLWELGSVPGYVLWEASAEARTEAMHSVYQKPPQPGPGHGWSGQRNLEAVL